MKTKNKAYDARHYTFKENEPILIDANVWLFLQPPAAQPTPQWATAYSSVFADLLKAKATPMMDALVLSEYINRHLRIEYDATWKARYPGFKAFRRSSDGKALAGATVVDVRSILKFAVFEDTGFSKININDVLDGVANGDLDFNDGVLIENCRLRGWKLLTHDGDMTLGGIDVLTANGKLLKKCP
ncbi:MAG: hypothetical protein H5U26_12555 [Immundisolibacter sp.]|uniref:hypothetical protein n=1 Tax=Immundisolibacter sp. TaxID=1934948 RepID=UPI0019993CE0|nr:hypothetical protein [Immundisolibacter sp.]MBC7162922.1 hypothetical protein [Immundisolibacter sp.]